MFNMFYTWPPLGECAMALKSGIFPRNTELQTHGRELFINVSYVSYVHIYNAVILVSKGATVVQRNHRGTLLVRKPCCQKHLRHYSDVIMGAVASQITSPTIVYSTVYSDVDQRKHQSSASLAFVWGIHRWPVNSPHKWPITRKCCHLMT